MRVAVSTDETRGCRARPRPDRRGNEGLRSRRDRVHRVARCRAGADALPVHRGGFSAEGQRAAASEGVRRRSRGLRRRDRLAGGPQARVLHPVHRASAPG